MWVESGAFQGNEYDRASFILARLVMLAPGTRVGPYEIVSWLGAGGMGEVYRARDTKLGREVALKTLPDELARQPDRLARLRQEARILAALNHPGIATLHGLEESANGVPVLVMELVEGESLADRIRHGALPPAEALKVAHAVAVALEAAHESGVLHRDLKPANIHIARNGRVKLLDFGLAKAVRDAGGLDSQVATQTSPSSGAAIVGTAPYLSPEQARGQEIDRRSDIWAFGCVLFEMLTRKRAFEGQTFSDTVAAILDREPDWSALPAGTPPLAKRLLARCLQKEKDKRLHDIGDARLELDELLSGSGGSETNQTAVVASQPHASWRTWFGSRLVWLIVGAMGAGAALRSLGTTRTNAERDVVRLAIPLTGAETAPGMAWSADATRVVYAAHREGRTRLYLRALDGLEPTPVPGTVDAIYPFCSPDGRWLAFVTGDAGGFPTLKKVPLGGGTPIKICDGCGSFGATWGPDDTIVYTPDQASGLFRVKADGGPPEPLTVLEADRHETSHRFPEILPDGRAVVFTVKTDDALSWDDARIEAVSLRTGERAVLIRGGSFARYVAPGYLFYHRAAALWAVPLRRRATRGRRACVAGARRPLQLGGERASRPRHLARWLPRLRPGKASGDRSPDRASGPRREASDAYGRSPSFRRTQPLAGWPPPGAHYRRAERPDLDLRPGARLAEPPDEGVDQYAADVDTGRSSDRVHVEQRRKA
jgi:eukaryotic-like serine/threonine-protein kinase